MVVPVPVEEVVAAAAEEEGEEVVVVVVVVGLASVCVLLVDMGDLGGLSASLIVLYFSLPQRFLLRGLSCSNTSELHAPLRRRDALSLMMKE